MFLHPNDRANDSPNSVAIVTINTNEKATHYKSYAAAWLSEGGLHMPQAVDHAAKAVEKNMCFFVLYLCPKFFLRPPHINPSASSSNGIRCRCRNADATAFFRMENSL